MRQGRFTAHQIVGVLKRAESGVAVKELCRELGISSATFYQWRSKYGGLEASDLKKLQDLAAQNRRLKQMYADLSLDHQILQEIIEKSSERCVISRKHRMTQR